MNLYSNGGYFDWLCHLVGAGIDGPFRGYSYLLERLFQTPYNPSGMYDENRAINGKLLRYYYETNREDYAAREPAPYHDNGGDFYDNTVDTACTLLEMMIAFSQDIDTRYLYSQSPRTLVWFWMMIESMGLAQYTDIVMDPRDVNSPVDEILYNFNSNAHYVTENGIWRPTVALFQISREENWNKIGSLWEQMQVWFSEKEEWLETIDINQFINEFAWKYLCG